MKTSFAAIVGISLIIFPLAPTANADSADYKIMPNPPNVPFLGTAAINNRGDVLGFYGLDRPYTSSMYIYSNNSVTFLPLPPGVDNVYGTGINSSGQVIGYFYTPVIEDGLMVNTIVTPFLYSNGSYTTLPQFPGATHTWPTAINDLGQIVGKWGIWQDGNMTTFGNFLYSNGVYTSLPKYPNAAWMDLTGINNLGQIVGSAPSIPQNGIRYPFAFIYQNGVFNVIDCLSNNYFLTLFNINDQGEVLGTLSSLPYIYKNGKCTMLPNYPGWNRAVWYAGINNKDQIIGTVNDYASNTLQWFMYEENTAPLTLTNVHVSQAVNDFVLDGQSNITLVKGKSTVIYGTVTASNNTNLDPATPITVTATLPDGSTLQKSVTLADAVANDGKHNVAVIGPFVPQMAGTYSLKATGPSPLGDSQSIDLQTVVKQTNDLGIVYVPMQDDCNTVSATCAGKLLDPVAHAINATTYIQNTYPVADGHVTKDINASAVTISKIPLLSGDSLMILDYLSVWLNRTLTNPLARNGVGIVPFNSDAQNNPHTYFQLRGHTFGTHGATIRVFENLLGTSAANILSPNTSLVGEDWWETTAHEVAHTFGVDDVDALPVTGFDVQNMRPIAPPVLDFMGSNQSHDLLKSWITPSTFGTIFKGLLTNPSDPQVMLLSGLLSKDGKLQLNPTFLSDKGYATPSVPNANGVVKVLNSDANIQSESSFLDASQLEIVTDQGERLTTDSAPFVVSVPFSIDAETIQIGTRDGQILKTIIPNSQLLIDTIKQIPNSSFKYLPKISRQLMLDIATKVEQELNTDHQSRKKGTERDKERFACADRVIVQLFLLRELAERDLIDQYVKSNPTDVIKSEVLRAIDLVILHTIQKSRTVDRKNTAFFIDPVPQAPGLGRDTFKISDIATQARLGKVSIVMGGALIQYVPNPGTKGTRETDTFSIIIKSKEGDQVTVTIIVKP